MAVALDCSFVARTFAGDAEHLKSMVKAAIAHKGFSLVDILQPCVSFNQVKLTTGIVSVSTASSLTTIRQTEWPHLQKRSNG